MLHSHPTIHDLMRADSAETRRRLAEHKAKAAINDGAVAAVRPASQATGMPTDSLAARASASATLGLMRAVQRLTPPRLALTAAPVHAAEPPEPSPTLSESWVAL